MATSLNATPYGQDGVEGDDRQRRHDHVEAVHGHAGVPVHAPPAELEVRQQVVAQERRPPHVGAHVAAGRRDVVEDQVVAEDRAGGGRRSS